MNRARRRVIGVAMIGVGLIGIVGGVTGVIIGQRLVGQLKTSVDDSLVLTADALAAVTESINVTDSIVDTVRSGTTSVESALNGMESSLIETSVALTDTGAFLGGSLPDALEAVSTILPTIESIAGSVDSALRVLERAPFGPDYNPVVPFDEAIATLSSALAPLPGQLRVISSDFDGISVSTGEVSDQIARLGRDLDLLDSQLSGVSALLSRYSSTATEAELLATSSRRDLAASASSARLLLLMFGIIFSLGQGVPIWMGTQLLAGNQTPVKAQ